MRTLAECGGGAPLAAATGAARLAWDVADSAALYRIDAWGAPYFAINGDGNLCVRPRGADGAGAEVELAAVVRRVAGRLRTPLVVRFPQIVEHRMRLLHAAFAAAASVHIPGGAAGLFRAVFPVKCNPDGQLLAGMVAAGSGQAFGLEAGSKAELLLCMSLLASGAASPDALLVCNGYKDAQYIRLAAAAARLGVRAVLVLEQPSEVALLLSTLGGGAAAAATGLQLGARARLSTRHAGHWGDTSGDDGKFGLTSAELVAVAAALRRHGLLSALHLLHFHVGSQIPSLHVVAECVSEGAHMLCDLRAGGAAMTVLDIGGGLGVDYDGSAAASGSDLSVSYSVAEYASAVVSALAAACHVKGMAAPLLCCESGRGLVSHHSVLVFDVAPARRRRRQAAAKAVDGGLVLEELAEVLSELPEEAAPMWRQVEEQLRCGGTTAALEYCKALKVDCCRLFKAGRVSLLQRAAVERVLDSLLQQQQQGMPMVVEDYCANMSIFKSLPDCWAIGQLFPIVPLQRLEEQPSVAARLSDLTCDSDGRLRDFIVGNECYRNSLPLHAVDGNHVHGDHVHGNHVDGDHVDGDDCGDGAATEPYYVGVFLAGAYQEALSSAHNLFGTMNAVHVVATSGGGWHVTHEVAGQTVAGVLRSANHDPALLFHALRSRLISLQLGADVARTLAAAFSSYTYLDHAHHHIDGGADVGACDAASVAAASDGDSSSSGGSSPTKSPPPPTFLS